MACLFIETQTLGPKFLIDKASSQTLGLGTYGFDLILSRFLISHENLTVDYVLACDSCRESLYAAGELGEI